MAVKPASTNDSLHLDIPSHLMCLFSSPNSFIYIANNTMKILLLLTLCFFIIYLGVRRWRQQRSTSAAAAATSHSDCFTYHMVAMELIDVIANGINCWTPRWYNPKLFDAVYILWSFTWYGETSFHLLTCVERYLAVVHPVTYLSLRGEKGTRLRNISIGCVWLLCCGLTYLVLFSSKSLLVSKVLDLSFEIVSLIIISFCSLSVLCVLIRPGPGEQGGARGRVVQSKRRAFYTILAILGAMVLRFCVNLVWSVLRLLPGINTCLLAVHEVWFNLPSSLVLPLLFLHRAGKLSCCKHNTK